MRGGFRKLVPVATHMSDDELIERTHVYRRAFNEHFRVHGSFRSARAFVEAAVNVPRLRPRPDNGSSNSTERGDAA